jgi:hypothetical protein
MKNYNQQSLSVRKREVNIRRKPASQQLKSGDLVFPELHKYNEMLETMRRRYTTTHQIMSQLSMEGIPLFPIGLNQPGLFSDRRHK